MIDLAERIGFTTNRLAPTFREFVEASDIRSELTLYSLGAGERELRRLIEADDASRVTQLLYGAARQFCEREKAAASGYSFADVAWYGPDKLRDLLPIACDPEFDGLTGETDGNFGANGAPAHESGNLLAMVADVRRALDSNPDLDLNLRVFAEHSDEHNAALESLSLWLGGAYPAARGYHARERMPA